MMKLTCEQTLASEALSHVANVVATKSSTPIVLNVRIVAEEGGGVTFYATDFERSLQYTLRAGVTVDAPGEVCLPARRLSDVVRTLDKDEPLQIEATKAGASIRSGRTRFALHGHDPADFPRLPDFDETTAFSVSATKLAEMVGMVAFGIHNQPGRYALNGVLFEIKTDALTLVGSDGKRLAMVTHPFEIGSDFRPNIIVPKKGLDLLTWVCDKAETVNVQVRETQILAKTENAVISAQLVSGLYPSFRDVLPNESTFTQKAVIDREKLGQNLRRAEMFTTQESPTVRFAFANNVLTMTSAAPQEGEAEVAIDIDYNYDPLEIGFAPAFLQDVLKVIDTADLTLMMKDSESPGILRQTIGGCDYLYLVMPTSLG